MANVVTNPEPNAITTAQMTKVREVDFVGRFSDSILRKLIEVLGVTRKIPMQEGTTMYVYRTAGTLQSGAVAEGEIIPLSRYARTKTAVGDITLNKWRKATTAEAIKKSGYQEAVNETDAKMLVDVQKGIRTDLFTFLAAFTGESGASGTAVTDAALYQIEHERRTLAKGAVLPQGMSVVKVGVLNLKSPERNGPLNRRTMCPAAYGLLLNAGLLYKGVER